MNKKAPVELFLLGLAIASLVAIFQRAPGYMDADYYFAGGLRLAEGKGFSESFLWNYLDDPQGLPHPSHAYWMPLASLLAAAGMKLSSLFSFAGARLGFLLVAACLPPLSAALSWAISHRRDQAWLAGLLAVFPAYYLPYLGTTDNFGIYMLLGGLWFLALDPVRIAAQSHAGGAADGSPQRQRLPIFVLGLIAGGMHLARSDGLVWLGLSGLASLLPGLGTRGLKLAGWGGWRAAVARLGVLMAGYLLVMGPWLVRNLAVFGSPLAPGGGQAFWLIQYDELYAYPAASLTFDRWWAAGLGMILQVRWEALLQNLLRAFAVQGNIFLGPLIMLGGWRLRADRRVGWGLLAWLMTLFTMTAVFPHQGWRGGFIHAGAALQPLLWSLAPAGLSACIDWGARVRGWQPAQARRVFSAGLVSLAALLAVLVVQGRVVGDNPAEPAWAESDAAYQRLELALQQAGAGPEAIVAVNNPAGYFVAAGRSAIAIPDGDEGALLAAARRYSARYVLLEVNHPAGLNNLYQHPGDRPGLVYLGTLDQTYIYRIE